MFGTQCVFTTLKILKKKSKLNKYAYRDKQRQLKDYLDKQVSDHKNKLYIEKNKDLSDYQHIVHKMSQYDEVQNK